ncbi:hypothetical protein HN031_15390 [Nocardioides sp. zg-1308]|uniref:hypothetical protein n=1 Tax=Nocardioides sp. zg-1308 TaxID=2736253 RepID=UPI001557C5D0|nr:hypothetical protein [Nocardioides sp. zg-1308]NPD06063.1 hypothetical protein [Nocardioides sp. zg-1308]
MEVITQAWNDDGEYLGLHALLDVVQANDWTWHLEEFHGTTVPGAGVNALELEERLTGGEPVSFAWDELLVFAAKVDQLIDGRISAFMPEEAEPLLVLEALDSIYWSFAALDRHAPAAAVLDRVAALSD